MAKAIRNPRNELLHIICVPAIVLTVIGFLWSIPVPAAFTEIRPGSTGRPSSSSLAIVYYFACRLALGIGAAVGLGILAYIVRFLDTLAWPLWLTCLVIFVVAWIGQFVGHAIEGKRPSFFKDLQFLLIGPLWLLGHLYRRLGIAY